MLSTELLKPLKYWSPRAVCTLPKWQFAITRTHLHYIIFLTCLSALYIYFTIFMWTYIVGPSSTYINAQGSVSAPLLHQCRRTPSSCAGNPWKKREGTQPLAYTGWTVMSGHVKVYIYANDPDTCDFDIRQAVQHLLVCPMMNTACCTKT